MRAWRIPWLRFSLVGGLLFALDLATPPQAAPPPAEAGLDEDALLVHEAFARGLHLRDDVVRRRLIQNLRFAQPGDARSEAELLDEALALGMHESDLVVRRRLAQKMRLLLAEPARDAEPGDAELERYRVTHAERFTEPERVTLSQLYFRDEARARAALARFARGAEPPAALGDALPLPRELPSHSHAELAARFGPAFGDAAMTGPDGRWLGPIRSSYGHHLVRIRERAPARLSPLAHVRSEVREALLAERADRAVRAGIAALRRP